MRLVRTLAAALAIALPRLATAQDEPLPVKKTAVDTAEALHLFLDCQSMGCDLDFLRTDLDWINYVRDRTAADVHVIVTSLMTGGGGEAVTLKFIGLKTFAGLDDEVKYSTPQGFSRDEMRHELSRVLKIGLGRYMLHTPLGARNLSMAYVAAREDAPVQQQHDPWNFWVFSVGANGFMNGESQNSSRRYGMNLSASRTTADWKFESSISGNSSHSVYTLDDSTDYVADSHSYYGNALLVKSLGKHLSVGGTVTGSSSSQQNIDFRARIAPALEYDFFDYDQYTRKRLVLMYSIGFNRYNYTDTTIFNRTSETRLDHQASLTYSSTAPWGSASVGLYAANYLSDFSQYHASVFAGLSLRVVRGLQVSWNASYGRVHDQITLPKEGASDAERLLRLRQLATSYNYFAAFSVSYTFGSLFNNTVNPRMGGGGGGMIMMDF